MVENNQDNNFNDIKLTNLDTITVDREPTSEYQLSTKKYIDDELNKNTSLKFSETLENNFKVSVGNDTKYLKKIDIVIYHQNGL